MTNGSSQRQARLSEALRANLRRRKSQARALTETPAMPAAHDLGEDPGDSEDPSLS